MSINRTTASANRSARNPKSQDLCTFAYSDGRRCRNLRRPGHSHLCTAHARKEAQALAGDQAGEDIAYHLSRDYISACDLSSALGRLFSAVAHGHIKPKTAATLAYLGQTLVQTLTLAQHEYINAFGTESWRKTIRSSFAPAQPQPESSSKSVPLPASGRDFALQLESIAKKS